MEQLDSPWTDFHEIWCFSIFRKYVEKIQVPLKYDKNNGYFTWRPIYIFLIISRWILLLLRNVSGKSCRGIKNTHFNFNNIFSEYPTVYEIMWKNIADPDRPPLAIWRLHIACWITKATNTHSEYVILIAFPLQQWLRERASIRTSCSFVSSFNP